MSIEDHHLPVLYTNLATWLNNLAAESNKLSGGSTEFKAEFLGQLVDCRSFLCRALSLEVDSRKRELLQTVVDAATNQVVQLERIVNGKRRKTASSQEEDGSEGEGKMNEAISGTIQSKGTHTFDSVVGLDHAKQVLRESLLLPVQFPALFVGCRAAWRSLLLYGPPGTGKTQLARAVSGEADAVFFSVSSSDLISSYVGESERLVKQLFECARKQEGPSVIFIDEIDSVCRERSSREEEYTRRVKNELLKQIEGLGSGSNVFLLCATNCPWELDTAFLRRFERRLYVPLPDRAGRSKLIRLFLQNTPHNISDDGWEMLETRTEGYSGSDIKCAVTEAALMAIREVSTATHWVVKRSKWTPCTPGTAGAIPLSLGQLKPDQVHIRGISLEDLLLSLSHTPPTVPDSEISRHDKWSGFKQNTEL